MVTKSEIRSKWAKVRECKMWAGEFMSKAAEAAADDDCENFAGHAAQANHFALLAAKHLKEVRVMEAESLVA